MFSCPTADKAFFIPSAEKALMSNTFRNVENLKHSISTHDALIIDIVVFVQMQKIVLILGAGPSLGKTIASQFAENGYQIALAARSLSTEWSREGFFRVRADVSSPEAVTEIFETVRQKVGYPNVVIYNGTVNQGAKVGIPS